MYVSIIVYWHYLLSSQGSHMLEKYLNIQDCLENKFALKGT